MSVAGGEVPLQLLKENQDLRCVTKNDESPIKPVGPIDDDGKKPSKQCKDSNTSAVGLQLEGGATFNNCKIQVNAGDTHTSHSNFFLTNATKLGGQSARPQGGAGKGQLDSEIVTSDVWIDMETAQIIVLLCRDHEAWKEAKEELKETPLKHITHLPGEIRAELGGTLQFKLMCEMPPNLTVNPNQENHEVTRATFQKSCHQFNFQLQYGQLPNKTRYQGSCEINSVNSVSKNIDTHHYKLGFLLPSNNKLDAEPSAHGAHSENLNFQLPSSMKSNAESSGHGKMHLTRVLTEVKKTVAEKCMKIQVIDPDGGSLELEKYKITVQPDSVSGREDITISLIYNADSLPGSTVAITQMLCKSSKFDKPIFVRLHSCGTPMPGKTLTVKIMVRTGGGQWEQIQQVIFKHGKYEIEYETERSCSYIALISEEDEKNIEYHLFCDIWVHRTTGKILFLFFKYKSSLKKARKVLESEHRRILPLPEEVLVGFGSTIQMEIQSMSHPDMKMISDDGSNGQLRIDHTIRDKSVLGLIFCPSPQLRADFNAGHYRFFCCANVYDTNDKLVVGGFKAYVHFIWPQSTVEEPGTESESSQTDLKQLEKDCAKTPKETATVLYKAAAFRSSGLNFIWRMNRQERVRPNMASLQETLPKQAGRTEEELSATSSSISQERVRQNRASAQENLAKQTGTERQLRQVCKWRNVVENFHFAVDEQWY